MKKKLLFASYNLDIGGIENALINLLNKINYEKYEVTLILEKKEGIFLNKLNQNVFVQEYRVSKNSNVIIRKFKNLYKKVKWYIRYHNKYNFSCSFSTYSRPTSFIARAASKNNSIYVHSNYKYIYKDEFKFKNFFNKLKINKFRKIIFVSNESKIDFISIYPEYKEKTVVISNLIDSEEILKKSKEKITEITNKKLLVFVGRLEEDSKQISKMIRVFKKINDGNLELWIIGDGQDKQKYISQIKENDNIKLLGKKENPYPYIKCASYIWLTSDYEGYPVIYNEAIILKKPIITTIDITDDYISIPNNYGYITSKNETTMVEEINSILKKEPIKLKEIDMQKINNEKMKKLEAIFDEVE